MPWKIFSRRFSLANGRTSHIITLLSMEFDNRWFPSGLSARPTGTTRNTPRPTEDGGRCHRGTVVAVRTTYIQHMEHTPTLSSSQRIQWTQFWQRHSTSIHTNERGGYSDCRTINKRRHRSSLQEITHAHLGRANSVLRGTPQPGTNTVWGHSCARMHTGDRIFVPRHGVGDVQFPHIEDLYVVVDAAAHHLLVIPRQAHRRHLVLVHKLRHGSSHPWVPQFDEAVVGAGSDEISRARYGTAVHNPSVSLKKPRARNRYIRTNSSQQEPDGVSQPGLRLEDE